MSFDLSDLNPVKGFLEGIDGIVSKYIPTKEKKQELVSELFELGQSMEQQAQKSISDARAAYMAEFKHGGHKTKFDSFVDGCNRLIRPGVTIYFLLMFAGVIEVPKDMPADAWQIFWAIIIFWFGGRLLKKDGLDEILSAAVSNLRLKRKS